MVEKEGYGVREDLPQQSTCQMPEVFGPHPLYTVALCELRKDSVYAVAKTAQQRAAFGIWVSLLGGVRGQKLYVHTLQLLFGFWRMVVAISDDEAASPFSKFWEHGKLVGVGRSHRDAGDYSRPTDPHMHPEAVESLPEKRVLAEGGLPLETSAAVGTGEQARAGKGIESQMAKPRS